MMYRFYEILDMIGCEIYGSIRDRINSSQINELKFYALTTRPDYYIVQYGYREAQFFCSIDDLFYKILKDLGPQITTIKRKYPRFMFSRLFNSKKRPLNQDEIELLETKIQIESLILETQN